MRIRSGIGLALFIAGCAPTVMPSTSPPLGFRSLPIDASLVPLILSALEARDAVALNLCVRPENRGQIAGAAWLPSAHAVGKYTPTNGNEPELKADVPVFLVQLRGRILSRARTLVDPVCMVQNGEPVLYVPYDDAGNLVPFAGMRLPTLSLPPLSP